jgi:drug/metabolite transporter (DMT)-like permease
MKPRDIAELVLLAALWGASFLFMRMGASEFGAVPLAGLRVLGATLVLLPILVWQSGPGALRAHWKPILVVGITNSAVPFLCFAYAALSISAGLSSIFNAASPLFGALIAWLWLHNKLSAPRVLGLLIGFIGVFGLAWSKANVKAGAEGLHTAIAIGACITGALAYGFSANFAKRYLTGVPPMAVAAGSQLAAAIVLALPTIWLWPHTTPTVAAWSSLAVLAVLCTGLAYILYFRLIAHVGPANAITVTFLIPAFAVAWGGLFLGEQITVPMLIGCAVILLGTALATGVLATGSKAPAASTS